MLGNVIESVLEKFGITQARVSKWLGKPCNCPEYKDKLNQLDVLARQAVRGTIKNATDFLSYLTETDNEKESSKE